MSAHPSVSSVDAVTAALADHDYLADRGLATTIFLATSLNRPLLLEGEAGVGKTEVAKVLAAMTGGDIGRCWHAKSTSHACSLDRHLHSLRLSPLIEGLESEGRISERYKRR